MSGRLVKVKQPEVNRRYQYWAKVGCDMELITVQVKRIYHAPYGNGRTSLYADVFGYGFKGSVQVSKLKELKQEKVVSAC
jgi:hypothetical protein